MKPRLLFLTLAAALAAPALAAVNPGPAAAEIREAVDRAVPLIQKGASGYTKKRGCFSCHHQTMSVLALTFARSRGFKVDPAILEEQVRFTEESLKAGKDGYRQGKGQGGAVDTAGYALMALDVGGFKPDETTAAVAEYLLLWTRQPDHWTSSSNRPPSEKSPFTATFVALRGLSSFGTEEQQERITARREKVREWLLKTPAADTEDRAFRLSALFYAKADTAALEEAKTQLLSSQREDGGWSQTPEMVSDAYATGTALVALHLAGKVPVSDPAYQRGLRFLTESQKSDGSWYVASRSRPFQPYFESGFPYGKDQFISMAGTCWATAALALGSGK